MFWSQTLEILASTCRCASSLTKFCSHLKLTFLSQFFHHNFLVSWFSHFVTITLDPQHMFLNLSFIVTPSQVCHRYPLNLVYNASWYVIFPKLDCSVDLWMTKLSVKNQMLQKLPSCAIRDLVSVV